MKTLILLALLLCSPAFAIPQYSFLPNDINRNYLNSNTHDLINSEENNIFDIIDLDSIVMSGDSVNNLFGASVAIAGDVNGDGFSDVITGASRNSSNKGQAYIYFGGYNMDNIADVTLTGNPQVNKYFGYPVASAGDVNNDGYSDVIISANNDFGRIGQVFIFFGGKNMDNIPDVTFTSEALDRSFGISVATAGDVNGDGYSDVIIGDYRYNLNQGRAYIYFGGTNMNNIADVILTGEDIHYAFGYSVARAGDINGDSFSDVIIGASEFSSNTGKAYIYFGGSPMNDTSDLTMTGEAIADNFGFKVSSAGDINGNGFSDVIVSANYYGNNNGRVYIFYGGPIVNNIPDVIMTGIGGYSLGSSVSTGGDLNNDGFFDILIGAEAFDYDRGLAFVYYGGAVMDTSSDITMSGESVFNHFGISVSGGSDLNGDGLPDFVVGASGYNSGRGRSYIYLTRSAGIKVNIKAIVEGLYYPPFDLLLRKDTVTAYLRQTVSPFGIVDSAKEIIDSVNFSGVFDFFNAPTGTYYISLRHLNSLETWSKSGGVYLVYFGNVTTYDFTSSPSQAFGSNLKLKGSRYCLFSGDFDQDGFIDLTDAVGIQNYAASFVTGKYISSDLNGDSVTDLTDVTICYDNSKSFIHSYEP